MYGYGYRQGFRPPFESFDEDAEALFVRLDELGVPENNTIKGYVNDVIVNWKLTGVWDELDFVDGCGILTSRLGSTVNWKDPNGTASTPENSYAGDWVQHRGFKGSTANQFRLRLPINPGDGGSYKFTQNNNSFGYVTLFSEVDENGVDMSAIVGTNGCEVLSNVTTRVVSVKNNFGTFRNVQNVTNLGMISSRRTASNLYTQYRNGYNLHDQSNLAPTDTAVAPVNLNFYAFCRNVSGVFSVFSNKYHACHFIGSGNFDHFTFYNVLDQYAFTPLGISPSKRVIFNGNSKTQTNTYINRFLSITGRVGYDILKRGLNGKTTPELATDGDTNIIPKTKPFLANDVFFFWEVTNHMNATSSNATTCYNSIVSYLTAVRAAHPNIKIVAATCQPRMETATFINANRQNDADLFDDTTVNGKMRNHLVQDGYADALADCASDPTMGIYSQGVAGVGEKNTTYYQVDELHETTAGYNLETDDYFHPAIAQFL